MKQFSLEHSLFGDGAYRLSRWQYLKVIATPVVFLLLFVFILIGIYFPERGRGSTVFISTSDVEARSRVYLYNLRAKQREMLEEGSTYRMP